MRTTVLQAWKADHDPRVHVSKARSTANSTCTVVALRGDLDTAALHTLVDVFDDAIAQDDSDVVIDLGGVQFIGAGWIGTLVRSRARLDAQDRELTLRSPPAVLHRLLELCGLTYLLEPSGRGFQSRGIEIAAT